MSERTELRVGDHIGFLSGFPFNSDYFHQEEGTRLIRIRDLVEAEGETFYRGAFDRRWLINAGDILIGMDGDFNIVRWRGGEALLNQRILKAEGKPGGSIDPNYFFFWCAPYLTQVHNRTAATTVKHLSVRDIERAKDAFPPTSEQRRIAEILSTVDEAIEQTEALVGKWQQMKAGLMHDLFTRGVSPEGHLRPTRTQAPHLYQQSRLGWIPKEWEVKPLGSFTQHDITYGIVQAGSHVEGGIPYVRTGDMWGNHLVREQMLCTTRSIADSYKRSEIRSGEIVCAIRATVGKVLRVPPELDGANLTQGTARIAPHSRVSAAFLLWAIRSERTQRSISLSIKGTTFMEITLGDLRSLPLAAPRSMEEQELIGSRLDDCDAAIETEEAHLAKLRQQKQGLMHDLLTGRVRVAVAGGG